MLDLGSQIEFFSLNFLAVALADLVFLCLQMTLVSPPVIGIIVTDP